MNRKSNRWKAENISPIPVEVARFGGEVHPAEDQWKGDGEGDEAAPHDEEVRRPAQAAALEDEVVAREISRQSLSETSRIAGQPAPAEKHLPAAFPVEPRRRSLQPHRVAISHAEHGEKRGES